MSDYKPGDKITCPQTNEHDPKPGQAPANVLAFPQRGGTPADDVLMGLPEVPEHMMFCGACSKHIDDVQNTRLTGWAVSPDGCPDCLTAREVRFLDQRNACHASWGEVTRNYAHLLGAAREAVRIGKVSGLRAMINLLDENARREAAATSEMLERRAAYVAAQNGGDGRG